MNKEITRIKKLPPDLLERKIAEFLDWLKTPPANKAEKTNKMITMIFLTINFLSLIGAIITYMATR